MIFQQAVLVEAGISMEKSELRVWSGFPGAWLNGRGFHQDSSPRLRYWMSCSFQHLLLFTAISVQRYRMRGATSQLYSELVRPAAYMPTRWGRGGYEGEKKWDGRPRSRTGNEKKARTIGPGHPPDKQKRRTSPNVCSMYRLESTLARSAPY